jgi:hypothetical protein
VFSAAIAPAHRRRQRATRIEDKQIVLAKIVVDLIEARVLDLSVRAINPEQTHLVAANAAPFRRFLRAQLRRQNKREGRSH